ncbi:MAG TPA: DUF389 domain-containing protein [Acidimicrobiia bacterium]|nr:DUF389 domain-containing protein [Acidimicrobiia bacterium]
MPPENEEVPELEDDEETADLDEDERAEERNDRQARSWWERRRVEPEERDRILGQLFYEGDAKRPFLYRFTVLQAASVVIAVIGIASDSPAIVIGAMLLSPLMTPVLSVAAAATMIWPKRAAKSVGFVVVASLGSMLLAWVVATLIPDVQVGVLPNELLARTRPTLFDLAVALAAGTAGGYAMVRDEVGSALPGVAVAVALVPPLAVVGTALDIGRSDLAVGAGLLYLTNLTAIVLAAAVVFLATGFIPTVRITRLSWQVALAVTITLIPVGIVAVPLYDSLATAVRDGRAAVLASEEVDIWLSDLRLEVVDLNVDREEVLVELTGEDQPPPVDELGRRLEEVLDREVVLTVNLTERRQAIYATPGAED